MENRLVIVMYTFAGLPVTDYATGYVWYARVLGAQQTCFRMRRRPSAG